MTLFYKIVNKISPKYLTDCITFPNPPWISVYGREPPNTNTNILTPFSSRTCKFQSSFFPACVFSWNRELTYPQRNAANIDLFKTNLLSSFKPEKKSIYGIADRAGLRFLTQLRVGLNPLRKYKFNHNFADTNDDLCTCGDGVEDVCHYFLDCHPFSLIRSTLLDRVSVLIGKSIHRFTRQKAINLLLYGSKDCSYDINKAILKETLIFIHQSEKFKYK